MMSRGDWGGGMDGCGKVVEIVIFLNDFTRELVNFGRVLESGKRRERWHVSVFDGLYSTPYS